MLRPHHLTVRPSGCSERFARPRLGSRRLTALLLIASTGLAAAEESAPARVYPVFGRERLTDRNGWEEAWGSRFTPGAADSPALLEFPLDKWTGLIADWPLDKRLRGRFVAHLRCRWRENPAKYCGIALLFLNADKKDLKAGRADRRIKPEDAWQKLDLAAEIPAEAASLRLEIACHSGGKLEIEDLALGLTGLDISEAAITGLKLPWLKVSGGELSDLAPESALAGWADGEPFAFDAPVWSQARRYPIPTTTCNKTALNDVSAAFQLAWNAGDLYVRFAAHDRTLNFADQSIYFRDCFEFFLMPTGRLTSLGGGAMTKEQYTLTRDPAGQTVFHTELGARGGAVSRLTDAGWEAILRIPLNSEARRIQPFNGLTLTFNAVYQDTNTVAQEHWLSFSARDQTNSSWRDPGLYVPLVFQTPRTLAYQPLWRGDDSDYNVEPCFPGRLNLIRTSADVNNLGIWGEHAPELPIEAESAGGHETFRFRFPVSPAQREIAIDFSPFGVLPGEVLVVEMEGRADAGAPLPLPRLIFVSQTNWQAFGFGHSAVAPTPKPELTAEWGRYAYTVKVPENFRENIRNGRLIMNFGNGKQASRFAGRRIELRDLRATRKLPADFDASISVPHYYSHFWQGEPAEVRFKFSSGQAVKAKLTATVKAHFSGQTMLTQEWERDLPAGESDLNWDVSPLPNGFFNLILQARTADGKFLADRELYLSKSAKVGRLCSYSGIFFECCQNLVPPVSYPEMIAMLRNLGIGRAQWWAVQLFDSQGKDLPYDPLPAVRAFKEAGFINGCIISEGGTHQIGREWQPDEMYECYQRSLTLTRGLIDYWQFANEPNLKRPWQQEADGREWAVYQRGFYNALRRHAPETKALLGAFNNVPLEYIGQAAEQDRRSFADGVMGVHLYCTEPNNEDNYPKLLESRKFVDRLYPGWEVWDTESGSVHHSFTRLLDLQAKKMPLILCAGYASSCFYLDRDLLFPVGDSNPLLPMEAFKNSFYVDCTPVGRVTLAGGQAHAYLFARADGRGVAALWNLGGEKVTAELPGAAAGEIFDLFGNRIGTLPAGPNRVELPDRFLRYLTGLDLAALRREPSFLAAFAPVAAAPAGDPDYVTDPFLSLPLVTRAFDRELPAGQETEFGVSLHNSSDSPRRVKLSSSGPEGLQITFGSGEEIELAPQASRIVPVRLKAAGELAKQPFTLAGQLADGKKLVPLIFTARTTPPVDVAGYTRGLEFKNNAAEACEVTVVPTRDNFFFDPTTVKVSLQPGARLDAPLAIRADPKAHDGFNAPAHYWFNVKWSGGQYTREGELMLFSPSAGEEAAAEFTSLPYSVSPAQPGSESFKIEYRLCWVKAGLRITARVQDRSAKQDGEIGNLKTGGDCLLVAFDTTGGSAPAAGATGYLEYGFACRPQAATTYVWTGSYGLETAKPCPETVRRLERDADYIYYDLVIPRAGFGAAKGQIGMSLAVVNRGADDSTQLIELGGGILPERRLSHLGVLKLAE